MTGSNDHEDILDAFHFYDNKGDKKIAVNQIGSCLRSLGLTPTEGQVEKMSAHWKNKPEARVTVEEFTPIYANMKKEIGKAPPMETFLYLLGHYDREGSGKILALELRHLLQNAGERFTKPEVDFLLSHVDTNDGMVVIGDFVRLVMSM